MTDFLSVLLGIVLGVLASVPVGRILAASTARSRATLPAQDVPAVEVTP